MNNNTNPNSFSYPTFYPPSASREATSTSMAAAASQSPTNPDMAMFSFAPFPTDANNQQYQQFLQQQHAFLLQQQQQQQQQQPVMFDPSRRDSMSRRVQSKAEKRAEHNAIERQRREGLNTRFQQLSHLLPNLHNDTRPSKGTIIERTLEFVRDAIKNEERYKAEIKDLRMTNRQLLKQLTHLTTGQCDEEDEEEVAAIDSSNAAIVHGNTRPMDVVSSSSPSPSGSVVATTPSPPPSSHQLPPQAVFKSPTSSMSSIQQHETSPSSRAPSLSPTTTAVPQMSLSTTSNPPLSPTMMPPMPSAAATSIPLAYSPMAPQQQQPCMIAPPPNTLGSSLSSFASDVWHDPTSHGPTWQDQQHPRRVSMSVQPTVYQVHPHGKMIVPKLDDMSQPMVMMKEEHLGLADMARLTCRPMQPSNPHFQ